jgi:hypothetical protein
MLISKTHYLKGGHYVCTYSYARCRVCGTCRCYILVTQMDKKRRGIILVKTPANSGRFFLLFDKMYLC